MTNEDRYKMLEDSFKEEMTDDSYRTELPDEQSFRPIFDKMAPKLSEIPFENCIVLPCVTRQRLDFELFCTDELHFSAAMLVGQTDDEVMYGVSHKKHNISIGITSNISTFVESALKSIQIIEDPDIDQITYEAMLELAESNESTNCWNNETWCKIAAWLRENKRPIDAPTAKKISKDYDDYEDIKRQLDLKWPTETPILTKGDLIKPE